MTGGPENAENAHLHRFPRLFPVLSSRERLLEKCAYSAFSAFSPFFPPERERVQRGLS